MAAQQGVGAARQPAQGVLDLNIVNSLAQRSRPGQASLFVRLAKVYLSDSANLIQSFHDANQHQDMVTAERVVHTLKSSSATIGAMMLSEVAKQAETYLKQGNVSQQQLENYHQQIQHEFAKVEAEIKKLLLDME
jgi:HPt (histidine-containing phosphotransfer) domain-containing protein